MLQELEQNIQYVNLLWAQDIAMIGRILRAHLFLEHFLTKFIQKRNPELGSIERARISFSQKLDLVKSKDQIINSLIPGIRRLNSIRNRVAHTMKAEISEADAKVFLRNAIFRAYREALAKGLKEKIKPNTIELLEDYAKFAGIIIHANLETEASIWTTAIHAAQGEEKAAPQ